MLLFTILHFKTIIHILKFIFFQKIHSSAFKDLRILVELDLSHNNLTHIEQDTFSGNERLQVSFFVYSLSAVYLQSQSAILLT